MTYRNRFDEDQCLTAVNSTNKNTVWTRGHIIAVRSGHLDEDFKNLEMFLRNGEVALQNNSAAILEQDTVISIALNVHKNSTLNTISPNALHLLCRLLCAGIQAYKRFLFRAENLNEEMIIDSIQNLKNIAQWKTSKFEKYGSVRV